MKIIIALLFSVLSIQAADDIRVAATIRTNVEAGGVVTVITKQTFTRSGQTNMVSGTSTTNGAIRSRYYRFVHDQKLAATYLSAPGDGYLEIVTHNGFDAAVKYRNNTLEEVIISDKDDHVLDVFERSNGVLIPIPTSELRKVADVPEASQPQSKNKSSK